jgi:hypothetical protein
MVPAVGALQPARRGRLAAPAAVAVNAGAGPGSPRARHRCAPLTARPPSGPRVPIIEVS